MVTGLNKVYKEQHRQRASIKKLQVYNNAFLTVQMNDSLHNIQLKPEKWGRHVESCIGSHLVNFARSENFKVFYWRHRNFEIDFVIEKGGQLIGLEVKSGKRQKSDGIWAFTQALKPEKVILIAENGLAWKEFLEINPVDLF